MIKKSSTKEALLLIFCAAALIFVMLSARFLRGDFTKTTLVYSSVQSDTQGYVVEKDGLFLININRADKDMLMMLDGIGETLAGRILNYREENGSFDSVENLLNVKGIGEKTLEQILPRIVCIPEDASEKEIPTKETSTEETSDKGSSFFDLLGGLFDQ